jgi:hypothetical protein
MCRFKVTFVSLTSMCVVSALLASTAAAALPVILNNKKEAAGATKFAGNTAKTTNLTTLEGFGITQCTNTKTELEFEAKKPLGAFHIKYTGCTTNLGGTCTGLGDAAGERLVLGTFHIVYDSLATLGAAMLFLLEHGHYACVIAGITKLLLVLGQYLCLLTPINALTKSLTVKCEKSATAGDPKEVVYWNEAGTEVNIKEGALSLKTRAPHIEWPRRTVNSKSNRPPKKSKSWHSQTS